MYKAYIRANKRMIICESDITLDRALDFLEETNHGVIIDSSTNKEYNKEELENVKNIRSLPGIGASDLPSSGGEVSEDPYRELFEFARDKTEPSTECDN